jgi:two-component system sensor histidine kinase HydH
MEPVEQNELHILNDIGRIATSSGDLLAKLHRVIEVIVQGMGKEGASVFLLDPPGQSVTLAAALGMNQESVGRLSFPLGQGIAGWVTEQKVPLALADPFVDPRFQYAPETGIERFKSLVAAPIMDEDRCLGSIFVLSADTWNASTAEVTLLTTVANQISGVIRSTQLFQDMQARIAELTAMYRLATAIASTLDLGRTLALLAGNAAQALHARGGSVRLLSVPPPAGKFVSAAVRDIDAVLGEAVAYLVSRDRAPLVSNDASGDPRFAGLASVPAGPLVSVPLVSRDQVIGVITLYAKEGGPFTDHDLRFLNTVAGAGAAALENAALYERVERMSEEARDRAQEFSILYDIGAAMSATLNLDRLLRIILTAATMGGTGLGFNRAVLLLTNERSNVLQGMMGVGPTSWEEASRAWTEVARRHKSLLDWIQTGELFEPRDTEINAIARSIRIPLEPGGGVLAQTVLEKQAFNVTQVSSDPRIHTEVAHLLKTESFATAPLIAKGRVIGAILVDNLFTRRPITDHDVRFLTMFAHQAALAIDNAMVHSSMDTLNRDMRSMHEQLAQSEKMAALGAMMAEITHEIRNPLVSIGGFARRLDRKLTDPDSRRYIEIILGEVQRLEGIIHDNLNYIKDVGPRFGTGDLNGVLEEVLAVYEDEFRQRNIRLERHLAPSLPPLEFDASQIKQCVVNLVTNAMEAMETGGVLTVVTALGPDGSDVVFEIGDTGPGVLGEAMHNLFNPYFTTKVRGTGLGLPITHRIVKAHRGSIVFRNKEAGGALFSVRLPLPQKTL